MYLIGGRSQPIRTADGMIHVVSQVNTGGFANHTTCGVAWRRQAEYASDDAVIDCMTCLVHEARS